MKNENDYIIIFLLLGVVVGLGQWLIITDSDDFITQMFGVAAFGVGLGGILLISTQIIISELKPDYNPSKESVT